MNCFTISMINRKTVWVLSGVRKYISAEDVQIFPADFIDYGRWPRKLCHYSLKTHSQSSQKPMVNYCERRCKFWHTYIMTVLGIERKTVDATQRVQTGGRKQPFVYDITDTSRDSNAKWDCVAGDEFVHSRFIISYHSFHDIYCFNEYQLRTWHDFEATNGTAFHISDISKPILTFLYALGFDTRMEPNKWSLINY